MNMNEEMERPPAMLLYAKDWEPVLELLTGEELGEILKALFRFLNTGEKTEFSDRAVYMFYEKMISSLERQIRKYASKRTA